LNEYCIQHTTRVILIQWLIGNSTTPRFVEFPASPCLSCNWTRLSVS